VTINTNYASGYASLLYAGGASAPVTTGTDSTAKQTTVATTLRQSVGVEVTLSPAALQALAAQAATTTEDKQDPITAKLRNILDDIFLNSAQEAAAADKALPPDADAARRKAAQQATDFLADNADNPFKGKNSADLAAIVIDTDGKYTVNERRAAFTEFARLDNEKTVTALTLKTDADRKTADAEVPKSNDPARLASAKQATDFVNGKSKNPFVGQTRDELTAIVANDTGDYTINERRAALAERSALEKTVRDQVTAMPTDDVRRQADRERPPNSDPASLDRARQATRFTYGLSPNPFAGLTWEELNSIVYDESKTYTLNERRAAGAELKQYLSDGTSTTPAGQTTQPGQTSQAGTPSGMPEGFDLYSAQGAYNLTQMRQMLQTQSTSMLVDLLNNTGSTGSTQPGSGLLNLLMR
jgi:hypothetical protein